MALPSFVQQGNLGQPRALPTSLFVAGVLAYALVAAVFWNSHLATGFLIGYIGNVVTFSVMTWFALLIRDDLRRYWRLLLALPLAPLYQIVFNWLPGTVGVVSDVLLFGNRRRDPRPGARRRFPGSLLARLARDRRTPSG